ncbi:MAG: HTH domain-containing protein [Nanoarchaeota archaeon]|nr:HTH domain-containing protein [Nanoarchaeota archaeon]
MSVKKTRYFEVNVNEKGFISKLKGGKKEHDFSDMKILRNLLSNEKARILYVLKTKSPESIYQLAKILNRDLKSIRNDIKVLEKFGFIDFVSKKKGNRISYSPILAVDRMEFILTL